MVKAHLYLITCITNLHCGKESENYESIDQLVQRDGATSLPCINGSSIKGAIREYLFNQWIENQPAKSANITTIQTNIELWLKIFGEESSETGNLFKYYKKYSDIFGFTKLDDEDTVRAIRSKTKFLFDKYSTSVFDFMQATLLSIPVPSDKLQYVNCTSQMTIAQLDKINLLFNLCIGNDILNIFKITESSLDQYYGNSGSIKLKGLTKHLTENNREANENQKLFWGSTPSLISKTEFQEITNDRNLPTNPRNRLENGESKNLWYEQFIPHETRFYTIIFSPDHPDSNEFHNAIDGKIINIGGNITVGFGKCLFTKIK